MTDYIDFCLVNTGLGGALANTGRKSEFGGVR